jgi:hypothetical protein
VAWKTVDEYSLGYDLTNKQFLFSYHLQGESVIQQIFPSPQEFVALADMFRNEGPISFNTDGNYFITSPEAIGEEEKTR